jgi:hypothetical protein
MNLFFIAFVLTAFYVFFLCASLFELCFSPLKSSLSMRAGLQAISAHSPSLGFGGLLTQLALDQYWLHELMACTLELKRRAKGNQGIR